MLNLCRGFQVEDPSRLNLSEKSYLGLGGSLCIAELILSLWRFFLVAVAEV